MRNLIKLSLFLLTLNSAQASFGIPGPWGNQCGPVTPDFSTVTKNCTDCITLSAECPKGGTPQTLSLKGCKRPLAITFKEGKLVCEKRQGSSTGPGASVQEKLIKRCKKHITEPSCVAEMNRCEGDSEGPYCQEWGDPPQSGWLDLKKIADVIGKSEKAVVESTKLLDESQQIMSGSEKVIEESTEIAEKVAEEAQEYLQLAEALEQAVSEVEILQTKVLGQELENVKQRSQEVKSAAEQHAESSKELAHSLVQVKEKIKDAKKAMDSQDDKLKEDDSESDD